MKKPVGLLLVAGFLILLGLRALIGVDSSRAGNAALVPGVAAIGLAALAVATGVALIQRRRFALECYSVWTIGYMVFGVTTEYLGEGEQPIVAGLWLVIVGSVFVAVGLYLRGALRQAGSDPIG